MIVPRSMGDLEDGASVTDELYSLS
jgi:hypothetical protein